MDIIDNVLGEVGFNKIIKTVRGHDFPWNLIEYGVSLPGDGSYYFSHEAYDRITKKTSAYNSLFSNLYIRLGVNILMRSKLNLTFRTKETYVFYPMHTDYANNESWSTAIFYLNTNNGYTLFEDGTKVDSVANRMVIFDGRMKHTGATHTDDNERFRFLLNINFR